MNHMPYLDGSDHPDVVRLRAEFDAARSGVGALDALDPAHRDRIVAELRTALPDAASRAARAVGSETVVAEIRRHADLDASAAGGFWDEIVDAATQAAIATC